VVAARARSRKWGVEEDKIIEEKEAKEDEKEWRPAENPTGRVLAEGVETSGSGRSKGSDVGYLARAVADTTARLKRMSGHPSWVVDRAGVLSIHIYPLRSLSFSVPKIDS
jgi:hypothetical protein